MVLPVSCIPQHKNLVLNIYRSILRNALNLDNLITENHILLIQKIRSAFRVSCNSTNSIQIQNQLYKAIEFNDKLLNAYEDPTVLSELFPTSKKIKETPTIDNSSHEISKKIRKNPDYVNLTDDEIAEFRSTREFPIPDSTKLIIPNIHIHANWYLKSRKYPNFKGKFDKRYLRTIFPSIIAHAKQKYYLNNLTKKLNNDPSHKLRRISGTGHYIYVINTPWNRDLRTEDFKFIGNIRKKYDELLIRLKECENYKSKFQALALEEANWERSLGINTKDSDWLWIFESAENVLQSEKYRIENDVINFCKRQGLIYKKIKPLFDEFHNNSAHNVNLLTQEIENSQYGAFTDVLDDGLGSLLKRYGFKDPLESKYSK
jgi:hypothetical protein